MTSSSLAGSDGVGSSLLRVAADEVIERWCAGSEYWADRVDEIGGIVGELLQAVEACREDGHSAVVVGELAERNLHHRLLEGIRARVLHLWQEGSSTFSGAEAGEVLLLVGCLERIRLKLWSASESELASRLAGPDAFELLVEVAHDLRSPVSSILFLAESLRAGRSGDVNALQRRQLGLIYSAAVGLMTSANDIVDAARGGGELAEELTTFSLRDIFEQIRDLVVPMAEEKEVGLEFRRPDQDYFQGAQRSLTRVLLNLTTNALKFTEEGEVVVECSRVGRTTLEFSVTDTGRGMDEESRRAVFQPFQKSEYRNGHFFSRSGLGLSIAKRLLEAMDAELRVESEVGVGTRFSFCIELPAVSSL